MSNLYFKIPVSVKPHVLKYLQSQYGNAIIISAENPASMVMYSFLQKKTQSIFKQDKAEMASKIKHQTKTIYLLIQKRDRYAHGIFIAPKNYYLINHFFEQQITMYIHLLSNAYQQINKSRKKAIEDFCKMYNIEIDEDITMDALIKNDQRHGQKLNRIAQNNQLLTDASAW